MRVDKFGGDTVGVGKWWGTVGSGKDNRCVDCVISRGNIFQTNIFVDEEGKV